MRQLSYITRHEAATNSPDTTISIVRVETVCSLRSASCAIRSFLNIDGRAPRAGAGAPCGILGFCEESRLFHQGAMGLGSLGDPAPVLVTGHEGRVEGAL